MKGNYPVQLDPGILKIKTSTLDTYQKRKAKKSKENIFTLRAKTQ